MISQASEWRPHRETAVAAAPAHVSREGNNPQYQEAGLGEVSALQGPQEQSRVQVQGAALGHPKKQG